MKNHNFPALVAMFIGYAAITAIAAIIITLGAAFRYFTAQDQAQPNNSTQVDAVSLAPIFEPVVLRPVGKAKPRSAARVIAKEWAATKSPRHLKTGG